MEWNVFDVRTADGASQRKNASRSTDIGVLSKARLGVLSVRTLREPAGCYLRYHSANPRFRPVQSKLTPSFRICTFADNLYKRLRLAQHVARIASDIHDSARTYSIERILKAAAPNRRNNKLSYTRPLVNRLYLHSFRMARLSFATFLTLAISSIAFAAPHGIPGRLMARDNWGHSDCGMRPFASRY
jgi:hypothetical protein